ncbi:MAG TPA: rhomboid family intramembrane serine protease, partial [Chloroflexota bacterium]|nr:rhomboid family intramembrane serine protease [Chloroflexota bacterium]
GATSEQTSGVAVWAHIGGFIAGIVLVPLFRRR